MARDKHSDKDRPRQRDVQKAYDGYSATEQGDRARAHEQPDPAVAPGPAAPGPTAPGQEAERGAYDLDHEYRRYDPPDRNPKTQPKAQSKTQPKTKGPREIRKRQSEPS